VNLLLNVILASLLVVILVDLLAHAQREILVGEIAIIVSMIGLRFVLQRGHLALASYSLLFFIISLITLMVLLIGTLRTPAISVYLLTVVMAFFLFPRRVVVAIFTANSMIILFILLAENAGLLPEPDYTDTIADWLTLTVMMVGMGLFGNYALNELEAALKSSNHELVMRTQIEAELRRLYARDEALAGISRLILTGRSPEQISEAALGQLHRVMPGWRFSLFEFIASCEQLQRLAVVLPGDPSQSQPALPEAVVKFLEAAFLQKAAYTSLLQGGTLCLDDLEAHFSGSAPTTPYFVDLLQEGTRSLLLAPLVWSGEMVGLLCVEARQPHSFQQEHIDIANKLAGELTVAIQHARLLVSLQHELIERRLAEEQMKYLNLELEQHVRARTAALEQALEDLENISYSISHDLRSPLRAIDGYSALLMEQYYSTLDQDGIAFLQNIRRSTQRLGLLLEDLVTLLRVSRASLNYQPVSLSAMAENILTALQVCSPERSISYKVEPGLVALGDQNLIQVVLENLLGNAWKFTQFQRNPSICFKAEEHNNDTVFVVQDNGIGFDMVNAHKLFSPFVRLHNNPDLEGTGIGLATVRSIIRRHGGKIWAEAQPGQGAAFYFTLPGQAAVEPTQGLKRMVDNR
jgi:signal transduction histidine kinase